MPEIFSEKELNDCSHFLSKMTTAELKGRMLAAIDSIAEEHRVIAGIAHQLATRVLSLLFVYANFCAGPIHEMLMHPALRGAI